MDPIQRYLEIIPLPVLALAALALLAVFVMIPRRHRLFVTVAAVVPWMMLGRMPDLGLVATAAKASSFASWGLVALAALTHPGPRRRLPAIAWLYLVTALQGFIYILNIVDLDRGLIIQFQWVILVVAALAVTRTVVEEEDILLILRALAVGLILAILVPLSNLVLHPGEAIRSGWGRFAAYGANANQIGIAFAMAVPITTYLAVRTTHAFWKPILFASGAVALGLTFLTASRSSLGVALGGFFPIAAHLTRRPLLAAVGAVLMVGLLAWIMSLGGEANLQRLTSTYTSRPEIAMHYLHIIGERPWFGLLGTEGESFAHSETARFTHPHNAYLLILFRGGLSHGLPLFLLAGWTAACTVRVWRQRRWLAIDPTLVLFLAVMMMLCYLHGFVNAAIIYPTYSWAFFHVVLSLLFISVAHDLKVAGAAWGTLDEDVEGWELATP